MADGAGSVAMQPVPSASNIGDGGDEARARALEILACAKKGIDLRGHSKAIAPLVPGDVVRDQPEARGQCARPATHSWPGQLSDRLGLAALQLRPAMVRPGRDLLDRRGRGGRNLCGHHCLRETTRRRGATDEDQVDRRDCGGSPRAGHWPDPNEPRRGCGCEEPDPVCPGPATVAPGEDRPNRWLVSLQWSGEPYDHQPRSISAVATRPTSSCHECIAWPLCLIAGGWASTMVPSMPTISGTISTSLTFPISIAWRRSQARGLLFFRLLQQAVPARAGPLQGNTSRGGHRSPETKCRGYESKVAYPSGNPASIGFEATRGDFRPQSYGHEVGDGVMGIAAGEVDGSNTPMPRSGADRCPHAVTNFWP